VTSPLRPAPPAAAWTLGGWTPSAGRKLTPPPPAPPSHVDLAPVSDEPMVIERTVPVAPPPPTPLAPRPLPTLSPPPQPEAVPHGDPYLAVHEFLDRLIARSLARSRAANFRVLRVPLSPCDRPGCFICRNPRGD